MFNVQILRSLLKERLPANDEEEIFELFERTTAEYEEELSGLKEENERQRKLLDAAFNSDNKTDVQQLLIKAEVPAEQPASLPDQEHPKLHNIKQEEEELWICKKEEEPILQVNSCMYADEDVKPQSSYSHQSQSEEHTEAERLTGSSAEQMKTEDDKEHWRGTETFLRYNGGVKALSFECDQWIVGKLDTIHPLGAVSSHSPGAGCQQLQKKRHCLAQITEEPPRPTSGLGRETPPDKRCKVLKTINSRVKTPRGLGKMSKRKLTSNQKTLKGLFKKKGGGEQTMKKLKSTSDAQTQWSDPVMRDHRYSKEPTVRCSTVRCVTRTPRSDLLHPVADCLVESDADSLLYTGIPLTEFLTLVACLQPFAPVSLSMPVVDQILMTFMKLRQNFVMADLARRFKVSQDQVSKTVWLWVDIMCEHMKDLTVWLPRETIKATLPEVFKDHFANTTCAIDCIETVLQKAKGSGSRSHDDASSTVKYLVAVSPSGIIMFISEAYSAECTDRYIVQTSGFLDYLRAGDEVMGDPGFTVRDLLKARRVNLVMPAFTRKGRRQEGKKWGARARRMARARIHVEGAMKRLKIYRILSQTVPVNLIPKIDKILKICAGLVNLRPELILKKR